MLTGLITEGVVDRVAQKAAAMSQTDPHGFTLTIVSVSVVFSALFILFVCYTITGYLFTRKPKPRKQRCGKLTEEELAAVSAALHLYKGDDISEEETAAIATALHLYCEESYHDMESGIITIKR